MSVLLEIKDTRDVKTRRIFVRDGQALTFGREAWNDVTLTADEIAPRHFRVTCQPDTEFQVAGDADGVHLNDAPVSQGTLNQDDLLTVGPFQLRVLHVTNSKPTSASTDTQGSEPKTSSDPATTIQLVDGCRLTADQEARFSAEPDPHACLDSCVADGDWHSAAMILLGLMSEIQRLDWLLPLCISVPTVNQEFSADSLIEQLQKFREQPDEELRRDLNKIGRQLATKNPWRWLLCMVFWAGESLGPADVDPIPPAPHLPIIAGLQVLQLLPIPAGNTPADARMNWIAEGQTILQADTSGGTQPPSSRVLLEQSA